MVIKTLEELISYGISAPYGLDEISFCIQDEDVIHIDNFCYEKYAHILRRYSSTITLTDDEYFIYKYKPKFLSVKLYRRETLWHLLLFLNNMSDARDFTKKTIVVYQPDQLAVLQSILIAERDKLNENKDVLLR
jgi:hypothetical protein